METRDLMQKSIVFYNHEIPAFRCATAGIKDKEKTFEANNSPEGLILSINDYLFYHYFMIVSSFIGNQLNVVDT